MGHRQIKKNAQRGFVAAEALVAVLVTAVLLGSVMTMLVQATVARQWAIQTALVDAAVQREVAIMRSLSLTALTSRGFAVGASSSAEENLLGGDKGLNYKSTVIRERTDGDVTTSLRVRFQYTIKGQSYEKEAIEQRTRGT